MISLSNLTITYGRQVALDHFSATFAPHTISALVGGDGAGKTTLLRRLAVPANHKRQCLTGLPAHQIGYQPATSGVWNHLSVAENLAFMGRAYRIPRIVAQARTQELLQIADLEGTEQRLAKQLSGGMRQKLGVIMAMLHEPALLLLDEPTTGVDQESRASLWRLIETASDNGSTVILATAYMDEAEQADQVFVLNDGRTLAKGTPKEVIAQSPGTIWEEPIPSLAQHREQPTRDTPTLPTAETSGRQWSWQRGHTQLYWFSSSAQPPTNESLHRATVDLELATIGALLAAAHHTPDPQETWNNKHSHAPLHGHLIDARHITHTFGSFKALDNVSVQVDPGEIVGLIGGNGAGKSTLIRIILGLTQPTSGTVNLLGGPPNHQTRSVIGYVPQRLGLYPTLSARENLAFTTTVFHTRIDADLRKQLTPFRSTPVYRLPLGAQRRLAVMCAMSHQPRLLLLDEPTSGMDSLARAQLWNTLRTAAQAGVGMLITTHYRQEARQCDRLIRLHQGLVVPSNDSS
ncbi:ATP-binding cassette domain-containing protein [Stomatohabitans albus]|uniref:ATP-binding cassette domain-containing protein n=1 Tax=Stomatohabitans albus TaxID=3110766 RepID=UPI00300D6A88